VKRAGVAGSPDDIINLNYVLSGSRYYILNILMSSGNSGLRHFFVRRGTRSFLRREEMTPSLSQVLTQGGTTATSFSIGPAYWLAGLAFFSLAAFSAVRGLVLKRRVPLMPAMLPDDTPSLAEIAAREKLEKAAFLTDQLKLEKEKLAGQNSELQGKVEELHGALSNVKQTRDTLEKSNLALLKESERLKAEKERLTLKASVPLVALGQGPETGTKPKSKEKKVKLQAISKIKKEARKPSRPVRGRSQRVSSKVK
jgi:hypothetical protein